MKRNWDYRTEIVMNSEVLGEMPFGRDERGSLIRLFQGFFYLECILTRNMNFLGIIE